MDKLIKKLNLYGKIQPQDPLIFVERAIDYIYHFNKFHPKVTNYRIRYDLVKFVQDQFIGIYKRSNPQNFIDISQNGLSTIGAILYTCVKNEPDLKLTQTEVANACCISEVTLRKYIEKLKQYYKKLE